MNASHAAELRFKRALVPLEGSIVAEAILPPFLQLARFFARPPSRLEADVATVEALPFTERRETSLAAASVSLSFRERSASEPSVTMPASTLSSSTTGSRPIWARAIVSMA